MKRLRMKSYETPHVEVIEIVSQGAFCSSADGSPLGGTETMNQTHVNWP